MTTPDPQPPVCPDCGRPTWRPYGASTYQCGTIGCPRFGEVVATTSTEGTRDE
jgi:hypothetical protein